ncbi:MAG: helix-turn-helix transcriptional regulator, partial [Planctomycetes bacterium]|nr:helix-turn-helix transcriptional regulator [Planctomycetota bacterium]
SSDSVQRLQAPQLLHQLMSLCLEHISDVNKAQDNVQQIEHAEYIASASLESDFGVAAFAAAAGLSPSRFHDCYKNLRGITPLRFLTDMRMQRARELLADSSLSIGNIASLVGHPDPTVFGRIFKREHGLTPRDYRRHN